MNLKLPNHTCNNLDICQRKVTPLNYIAYFMFPFYLFLKTNKTTKHLQTHSLTQTTKIPQNTFIRQLLAYMNIPCYATNVENDKIYC